MPAPTSRPQPPSAWRSQPPQRPSVTGEGKTRRNSYVKKYEADVRLDWQEHAACLGSAPDFDYDQKPPPRVQAANPRPRKTPEHVLLAVERHAAERLAGRQPVEADPGIV